MRSADASKTNHANGQASVTTHQDFVGPPVPRKRPDGTDIDVYARCMRWSYHQWAWAFLRRNKEFRKACKAIKRFDGDIDSEMARVAALFGLKRYKPYTESFSNGRRPLFDTSRFLIRANLLEIDQEPKIMRLLIRPGELAVRLDLSSILNNAWGLRSQLIEVGKRVRAIVEEIEQQPSKFQIEKSPIERISPEKLIEYLRMLDHRNTGATQVECDVLVNEKKGKDLKAGVICKDDLYSNASDKQGRAEFFAKEGYLYLAARSGRPGDS